MPQDKEKKFILFFEEIDIDDIPLVGGKNASLGEMIRNLKNKGIKIPEGFAITSYAYDYFIKNAGIEKRIKDILKDVDTNIYENLATRGEKIRHTIIEAEFPEELKNEIIKAYNKLEEMYGKNVDVAVRSSATAEDLPDASFAGQQETFLNISGAESLILDCKKCFASLFTNRAISYRHDKGFDHFSVKLSIGVQKMARSDTGSSGVIFTIDTESGFKDVVLVTSIYGLGENIVQGVVNPDEFYVFKPTLKKGYKSIINKKLGAKQRRMIYSDDPTESTKNIRVEEKDRNKFSISDEDVLKLARWAVIIEDHYSNKKGKYTPMDIEWAKDGTNGELYILQARPETVHSQRDFNTIKTYILKEKGKKLVTGQAVGDLIGQGMVNIIRTPKEISLFREGEILVTEMTDPDWEPVMKKASAIVTNRGGRTCHAAIVSRELGIPCIVGTDNSTEVLSDGQKVTVSCAEGEIGAVYDGLLKYEIEEIDIQKLPETRTKIMMNVGIPEKAFYQSQIPNDGVGLAREEFIINSYIGIHPMALVNFEELSEKSRYDISVAEVIKQIEDRTGGYQEKTHFYIDKLKYGISMIAAAFYPKDVILRLSDFKSNEYENLIGGKFYEPKENNPMIGWRGASRYYDENFKQAFALECNAIKRAREEIGLANIKVMVPFCRTPAEGRKVVNAMKDYGLVQGENGLEIYVMCEIPSNVLAADEFCEIFDGFSIGSNDLTQLALGLDRDSELVSSIYDERNIAVKRLIKKAIEVVKSKGKKIGICGQAPSDFPEFASFLVESGIDSISLNPDTIIKTRLNVWEKEKEMGFI